MVIDFANVAGGGVQPTGTINISQNGSYDVTDYASAAVSVETSAKPEESLSETLTENSTYVFSPTPGSVFSDVTVSVSVPSDQKPEEQLNVTLSANGDYSYSPTPGSVFSDVTVSVSVSGGITPTGTINISSNGTFDVTSYASAAVSVSGGGQNYSYMNGTVDASGLEAIGWDAESIGYLKDNAIHYSYDNDNYIVSASNRELAVVVDASTYSTYKTDPAMEYVPNFDMTEVISYSFLRGSTYVKAFPKLVFGSKFSPSRNSFFRDCKNLIVAPVLDLSNAINVTYMFSGCSSLKYVPTYDMTNIGNLSSSATRSVTRFFQFCSSLVYAPMLTHTDRIERFNNMFEGCTSLKKIPSYDTSSGTQFGQMFKDCSSIETIPFLDTSSGINFDNMFYNCLKLKEIQGIDFTSLQNDPGSIFGGTSYGDPGHYGAKNIVNITINGSINYSMKSFRTLKNLTYESVCSILEAMAATTNTDSKLMEFDCGVEDPNNEIAGLITECESKGWTVAGLRVATSPVYVNYDGYDRVIPYATTSYWGIYTKYVTSDFNESTGQGYFVFDDVVTDIPGSAFVNRSDLIDISLPQTVMKIGNNAFRSCSNLGLNGAFGMQNTIITTIGQGAFRYCPSLTNVILPATLTSIGNYAFEECENLNELTIEATTPPTLGTDAFLGTQIIRIYIPSGTLSAYQAAWPDYSTRFIEMGS